MYQADVFLTFFRKPIKGIWINCLIYLFFIRISIDFHHIVENTIGDSTGRDRALLGHARINDLSPVHNSDCKHIF